MMCYGMYVCIGSHQGKGGLRLGHAALRSGLYYGVGARLQSGPEPVRRCQSSNLTWGTPSIHNNPNTMLPSTAATLATDSPIRHGEPLVATAAAAGGHPAPTLVCPNIGIMPPPWPRKGPTGNRQ
jgi:hypothetical protein